MLEEKILNLIEEITCSKYNKKLKVTKEGDIYTLNLSMNQQESPLVLSYQGTESKFLEFLKKEFKYRMLETVPFFNTLREDENKTTIITIDINARN